MQSFNLAAGLCIYVAFFHTLSAFLVHRDFHRKVNQRSTNASTQIEGDEEKASQQAVEDPALRQVMGSSRAVDVAVGYR
jgi:hypothetical protein